MSVRFCGGEFTAHKITVGWRLLQWSGANFSTTLCANLGDVFEIVGAAKGLSDESNV